MVTTNVEKHVSVYLNKVQEIEQLLFDVLDKFVLGVAVGDQLDILGKIVVEGRNSRNDDNYRRAIRAKILVNNSNGTIEELLAIILALFPEPRTLVYTEPSYPMHFEIDIPAAIDFLPARIVSGASQTYALTNGDTLFVAIDGGVAQTATFVTADFVDIAAATAAEVAARIQTDITGANSEQVVSRVEIISTSSLTTSSVEVTGGTAASVFSFPTGPRTLPEENQDFMIQVARVIKSSKMATVRGILKWFTASTGSFGFSGTPSALGFGAGLFASASDGA